MKYYPGSQISRYLIIDEIGAGGMAVVYKAHDTLLERDVALKLIRTEAIPRDQYDRLLKRFEREAKAQARFSHRNIVPIHDYGDFEGSPYIVMSYCSGGTLKDRIKGSVPWQQGAQWLIPLCEALSYSHQRGVVHRDIKPSNILFDDDNQPILTDFGIAKVLESDDSNLTGIGVGVGTPEYMAPEQWKGEANEKTDQYALGVVFYELLTSKKPYSAETPAAVAILQATEPLEPPSKVVRGLPGGVEQVLYKSLSFNSQDRYSDMSAFRTALERLLSQLHELPDKSNSIHAISASVDTPNGRRSRRTSPDDLDSTEDFQVNPHLSQPKVRKTRFPNWAILTGVSILIVIALLFILRQINIGGFFPNIGRIFEISKAEPATETATPIISMTPTESIVNTTTPVPTRGVGSIKVNDYDGAELVYVPSGDFERGSEKAVAKADERPRRWTYIDSFWIYKYEVTNKQYRLCIEAGGCDGELSQGTEDENPVVFVNWNQAADYCVWAGGRLPTETEWEKAARGTYERGSYSTSVREGLTYPWGDTAPSCEHANYKECGLKILPVGSLPKGASPYGVMDMAGNVWEWVDDWYQSDFYATPASGNKGSEEGSYKVLRGGSWYSSADYLRTTARFKDLPNEAEFTYGFRCVQSPYRDYQN